MLCSLCRRRHCAPQTVAMIKQQEKALVKTGCQETPCVNCSSNCGALRMTPAAVDGRNNRDTTDPKTVIWTNLHAWRCRQYILSLGLRCNVVGANLLWKPLLLEAKSRFVLPSIFPLSLSTLKCNPRQGLAQAINYSTDWAGGNGMIPRRLSRVAIISSIGGSTRAGAFALVITRGLLSFRQSAFQRTPWRCPSTQDEKVAEKEYQ